MKYERYLQYLAKVGSAALGVGALVWASVGAKEVALECTQRGLGLLVLGYAMEAALNSREKLG